MWVFQVYVDYVDSMDLHTKDYKHVPYNEMSA